MKILLVLLFALIQSCSSSFRSINKIFQGHVDFKTGTYQDYEWDDSMVFTRTSWYKGGTMAYDALLYRVDRKSPFVRWLEESEKEYLDNCHPLVIGFFYSGNDSPSTVAKMKKEITDQNYEEVNLLNFKEYIQGHPTHQLFNLWSHKMTGFCGKHIIDGNKKLYMSMPNYSKIKVLD